MDMLRNKAGHQSAEDPFKFIMSSEAVDRTGDIIRQNGWELRDFLKNPIALFGHRHDFPIGSWKNVRVEGKRLVGDLVLASKGTSERIDEIRSLVEQRVLKAVSVGFRVLDYVPIDKNDPYGAWDIKRSELLETSVVSVPAHQDALLAASALGISRETQKLVFMAGKSATPPSPQSQAPDATAIPRDYSEFLGASSSDIRAMRLGR